MQGDGNHFYGKSHKPESLQKIMDKKAYYPYQGGRVKWYRHTRNDGKEILLLGTWEFETARWLDKMSIEYLVHGEFKGFSYKTRKRRTKFYQPDFYLPLYDSYLEVKGHIDDTMVKKMDSVVKKYSINLILASERELIGVGILTKKYKNRYRTGYYNEFLVKKLTS